MSFALKILKGAFDIDLFIPEKGRDRLWKPLAASRTGLTFGEFRFSTGARN